MSIPQPRPPVARAAHLLFLLSGAAGLIYQVAWIRVLSNAFGVTVYSASLVTAVFMAGLGVGSWAAGAWSDRHYRRGASRVLAAYGVAEVVVGLLGAALAFGLPSLGSLGAALSWYGAPGPEGWHHLGFGSSLARYGLAAIVLLPSTFLMGATLPLLVRFVVAERLGQAGGHIGRLYGLNTVGAAAGCFLTDLWLVPSFGLTATQLGTAAVNVVVGMIALGLSRRATTDSLPRTDDDPPASVAHPRRLVPLTAAALACFGAVALGLEIVWFRFLLGSLGAFRAVISLVLAVMLLGMGVGAWLGGVVARRVRDAAGALMVSQGALVAIALATLATFDPGWGKRLLASLIDDRGHASESLSWATQYAAMLAPVAFVVLVPALLMGASYPLANAHVQRHAGQVGARAATLYLGNTAGNVVGALGGGFLLLPALGSQATLLVLAVVGALGATLVLASTTDDVAALRSSPRRAGAVASLALILGSLVVYAVLLPVDHLMRQQLPALPEKGKLLAFDEGTHETIAITETEHGGRSLWTNRHMMSATDITAQRYMRAFSHIPLLQLEAPKEALVICFGVGSTVHAASLHPLERLEVVDLSEDVLDHARFFSANHRGVLDDPRVEVFVNDGRQHLRMTERRYDLITLEPPPIAAAGVSALYSVAFYELAAARLRPGGFVAQWLPIYQVPSHTARELVRAFVEVFPNAVLLSGHKQELILLGRHDAPNVIDLDTLLTHLEARPTVKSDLARLLMASPTELVATFVADSETLVAATANVAPLRDDRPTLEYTRQSHAVWTELPLELFAVDRVSAWCPSCFRDGEPRPEVALLPDALAVLGRLYESPSFAIHTSLSFEAPGPDFNPEMIATIQRVPYLKAMLTARND